MIRDSSTGGKAEGNDKKLVFPIINGLYSNSGYFPENPTQQLM